MFELDMTLRIWDDLAETISGGKQKANSSENSI